MNKTYVFLADGFEEIEGLTVIDILRRGGVDVTSVSVSDTLDVTGTHGITVKADAILSEIAAQIGGNDTQALVLPGGMPGTLHLGECQQLCEILKAGKEKDTWLCAICAAPSVFGDLGLAAGEKVTSYPGFAPRMTGAQYLEEAVVVSGKMITSRGMGTAIAFSLMILEKLTDAENAQKIGKSIIYL